MLSRPELERLTVLPSGRLLEQNLYHLAHSSFLYPMYFESARRSLMPQGDVYSRVERNFAMMWRNTTTAMNTNDSTSTFRVCV